MNIGKSESDVDPGDVVGELRELNGGVIDLHLPTICPARAPVCSSSRRIVTPLQIVAW